MAWKIVRVHTDDLTGEVADQVVTHTFALDGVSYEIDLAPDGYGVLLRALRPYIEVARAADVKGRTR